jgi:hypothetical protein
MEFLFENIKDLAQQPTELMLTIFSTVGLIVLASVRRWFKKGGIRKVIKMSFGYVIHLVSQNSESLTDEEVEEKKKLVDGIVNLPELAPYFDKADAKFEQIIDDYEGRINDINAKLEITSVKGDVRGAFIEEKKKLEDKLVVLYEKANKFM